MSSFTIHVKRLLPLLCTVVLFHVFSLSFVGAQQLQNPSPSQLTHDNFGEEALKKFVEVNQKVKKIEHASEDKMIEAIKAENLEVKKFNELLKAQQNNALKEVESSAEELAAFHAAVRQVQSIQQDMSVEITLYVEQEMGIELYRSIMYAYQHSPQLRDRINNIYHY